MTVSRNGMPLTPALVIDQLRPVAVEVLRSHVRDLHRSGRPGFSISAPTDPAHGAFGMWVGMPPRHRGEISVDVDPSGSAATLTAHGVTAEQVLGVYADAFGG
ncbi:MAG: hypothetical protein HY341_02960 [Candidatus Kerfeldbacteria bacterium]|nr:hypothetical protein [Candidatus Kerfeldbacteria bacterium]